MTRGRNLISAVAGLASIGLTAIVTGWSGSAAAQPLQHDHFHDVSSEVIVGFCDDMTIRIDADVSGTFLGNPHGPAALFYGSEHQHGSVAYTNLATGKAYSTTFNTISKDLKVTDNGDGTLTILELNTGGQNWYGPDGKILLHEPGQIRFEILIDDAGTPSDPNDDVFLDFLAIVKGSTGRNDTAGRDFCVDLHQFTA
jgi:hypothetical protein